MRSERPTCSCYSHSTLAFKPNWIKLINRLGRKSTPAAAAPTYAWPRVKLLCGIDKTSRWIRSKRSTCSCCSLGTLAPQAKPHQTDRYIRSENHTNSSSSHGHTEGHKKGQMEGHLEEHIEKDTHMEIIYTRSGNTHGGDIHIYQAIQAKCLERRR